MDQEQTFILFYIFIGAVTALGLMLSVPKYIRFARCKAVTVGTVTEIRRGHGTGSQGMRIRYEYTVDGMTYKGGTDWGAQGRFSLGGERTVKYNEKNPRQSYMPRSGQLYVAIGGTFVTLAGIAGTILLTMLHRAIGG